ncbi:MAG: AbrB/MazE/SpoVT family DNA-binding domain-containing protein [Dehalococcoidales bacterium]|nr:AbrB/MazE/SpoVT family DNA-binding domain-containing protein [Dehalococcoidales bacterium]
MATSTVSEKGWIVIPGNLRKRYGLKKGDKVHIIDYGGVISIIPVSDSAINDLYGSLKGKTSLVQELLKSRRQDAERDR